MRTRRRRINGLWAVVVVAAVLASAEWLTVRVISSEFATAFEQRTPLGGLQAEGIQVALRMTVDAEIETAASIGEASASRTPPPSDAIRAKRQRRDPPAGYDSRRGDVSGERGQAPWAHSEAGSGWWRA